MHGLGHRLLTEQKMYIMLSRVMHGDCFTMLEKDCGVIRGDLVAVGFSDRPHHDAFCS
jgi:hypothetical protein